MGGEGRRGREKRAGGEVHLFPQVLCGAVLGVVVDDNEIEGVLGVAEGLQGEHGHVQMIASREH